MGNLADDEDLYQEIKEMNKFETKCAMVVIGTLLMAVFCLFIGVWQVDRCMEFIQQTMMDTHESLEVSKNIIIRNMSVVKEGLSLTNEGVAGLKFVGSELGDYLNYAIELDEDIDKGVQKVISSIPSILKPSDPKKLEALEDNLKKFIMGQQALKEEKKLRKTR